MLSSSNETNEFPLLQLPENVQKNVVQLMNPGQKIMFSTLNKTTKNLARSAGLRCLFVNVYLREKCEIEIASHIPFFHALISFVGDNDRDEATLSQNSLRIRFKDIENENNSFETKVFWKKNSNFVVKDWIQHFLDIFNRNKIPFLSFKKDYDFNTIRKIFGSSKIEHLALTDTVSQDFICQILDYLPHVQQFRIPVELPNREFSRLFIQNVPSMDTPQKLTLNDLLLSNTSVIKSQGRFRLSLKEMNRFIKLWIAGVTSPMLKHVQLISDSIDDPKMYEIAVLRGIKYQRNNEMKTFEGNNGIQFRIKEGFNIKRKDGNEAIIRIFDCADGWLAFDMLIRF